MCVLRAGSSRDGDRRHGVLESEHTADSVHLGPGMEGTSSGGYSFAGEKLVGRCAGWVEVTWAGGPVSSARRSL